MATTLTANKVCAPLILHASTAVDVMTANPW